VDAWLAIASRREVREYAPAPLGDELERRILEAGRISGSSKNTQPWTFVVIRGDEARERAAKAVYAPGNVEGAAFVVAVVVSGKGRADFDAGRAMQNMVLAAWADGVGSCPNGVSDRDAMGELLELADEERVAIVLTFGRPAKPRDPARRSPEAWLERADRRPLDEIVREVG
jgi:nitroreductase